MPRLLIAAVRYTCLTLSVLLLVTLVTWSAAAPLLWILRDGLGPDMVETTGAQAAAKFLLMWGIPALSLGVPMLGLALVARWLGGMAVACGTALDER